MPNWITTQEAADLSGYDIQHVRRLARQGKIGAEVFPAYLNRM